MEKKKTNLKVFPNLCNPRKEKYCMVQCLLKFAPRSSLTYSRNIMFSKRRKIKNLCVPKKLLSNTTSEDKEESEEQYA